MTVTNLALQRFIAGRSRTRWIAHQLLFWGCVLGALVTFPLTFGWLHFESADPTGRTYQAFFGPLGTITFEARSVVGFLFFHQLNVAAILVIAGVLIFLARRFRDRGAIALERAGDFAALAGLFAVSLTGLMLTASSLWMEGRFYSFLNTLHALTVILGLLYIPFGKLFHILQRPANLGVALYKREGAEGEAQIAEEELLLSKPPEDNGRRDDRRKGPGLRAPLGSNGRRHQRQGDEHDDLHRGDDRAAGSSGHQG
jgi:hypothetical protein